MSIQWSLVLFTALTGLAGWMFACVAADEFLKKAPKATFMASAVALVVAIAGGLASVTHLAHPENIMGALSHPTSGIFIEALLTGLFCLCVIIYMVLVKREAGPGARKAFAVLGAIFGIVLSFMAGESYMMAAQQSWNTILLPLGYLGTAAPAGVAAYLCVAAGTKAAEPDELKQYDTFLIVAGAVAAVTAAAFALAAGNMSGAIGGLLAVAVVAGVVAIVVGVMQPKKQASTLTLFVLALACTCVGAICYRCIMWLIANPVANLFLNVM